MMREPLDPFDRSTLGPLKWALALIAIAMLTWIAACGEKPPSASTDIASPEAEGDFVAGIADVSSLTTLPPPERDDDPKNRRHGILLAQDQPCPFCTLITPNGKARVHVDTALSAILEGGEVVLSLDEFNDRLHVGIPLKIRVDDGSVESPFAIWVLIDRHFATTGSADRSSAELQSTGELILSTTTEASGPVTIPYELDTEGEVTVEAFEAGDRIFVSGIAVDGRLVLRVARPDV